MSDRANSDLLGLVGCRFVTVVEPEAGPWLRAEAQRRPTRVLPAELLAFQPNFSLVGPVAGLDHGQFSTIATEEVPA